jgi:hypothetical protein
VPATAFAQRIDGIEKMLGGVGEVTTQDLTRNGRRTISFRADAPGYGAASRAVFEYRERYRRIAPGWIRDRYVYEFRPEPQRVRRAYHDHPPRGVHQHCRDRSGPEAHSHYVDRERLLEEAHEEFIALFFGGVPIDCGGLRPLT